MKKLIIIGASGFGREVAWLVERINKVTPTWDLLGFIDDNVSIRGKNINGYTVLGTVEDIEQYPDVYFVCAIGSSKTRKGIIERIEKINPNTKFGTVIDPSVEMSDYVKIGKDTIICAHTLITVNVNIGNHVIINLDCTIGHDAVLHDYVTLYPSANVSGNTVVGHCSELGTGMQIIQGKNVGGFSVIGAGTVVVKDIDVPGTYVGVPAKKIGTNNLTI